VAFHIGYRKTASTWFQWVALPRHPAIRIHLPNVPGDDPFLRHIVLTPEPAFDAERARHDIDRCLDDLAVPDGGVVVVSSERFSGHPATGGYDTFQIAGRLAEVAPDAKVFYVVREQVAMIESEYLQLVQEGSVASLQWVLGFRPRAASMPGFDLRRYEYDRLADRYVELFGADRVRLFEFGALTRDPRRFLDEVSEFLEIEPWPHLSAEELGRRVNPGLPKRLIGVRRFFNHFERRPLNPHPLVALPPVWRGPLWWLASRLPPRKHPVIDPETQAMLRDRYRDSNARLAQHHGVKLPTPD
jgi:hypothetical protein